MDTTDAFSGGGVGSRRRLGGKRREVCIGALISAPERVAYILCQWMPVPEALGQIGVRREPASEGDQISVPSSQDGLGALTVEATCGNDRTLEDLAQEGRRDRGLAFVNRLGAHHARLNHVQIGEPISVEALGEIAESGFRVAVRNRAPASVR